MEEWEKRQAEGNWNKGRLGSEASLHLQICLARAKHHCDTGMVPNTQW